MFAARISERMEADRPGLSRGVKGEQLGRRRLGGAHERVPSVWAKGATDAVWVSFLKRKSENNSSNSRCAQVLHPGRTQASFRDRRRVPPARNPVSPRI